MTRFATLMFWLVDHFSTNGAQLLLLRDYIVYWAMYKVEYQEVAQGGPRPSWSKIDKIRKFAKLSR